MRRYFPSSDGPSLLALFCRLTAERKSHRRGVCMFTLLWSIYSSIILFVSGILLAQTLTRKQTVILGALVIVGVVIAYFSYISERAATDQANKDSQTLGAVARNEAKCAKPGLQQDALKLGSILMNRGSEILILESQRRFGLFQVGQFQAKTTQLLDDYKTTYAKQVIALRQGFLDQGLEWENEQYYSNPTDAREVANIGMDLIRHANQLN